MTRVPPDTGLVLQRLLVPVLKFDPLPGGRRVEADTSQLVRHCLGEVDKVIIEVEG